MESLNRQMDVDSPSSIPGARADGPSHACDPERNSLWPTALDGSASLCKTVSTRLAVWVIHGLTNVCQEWHHHANERLSASISVKDLFVGYHALSNPIKM